MTSHDSTEPVYSFSDGILSCKYEDADSASYRCITKFTLAVRAWWRKTRLDYCSDMHIDAHSESIRLVDMLNYVLDDKQRFHSSMELAYPGSTEISNWFDECPSEIMEEALAHFFVSCLINRRQSK